MSERFEMKKYSIFELNMKNYHSKTSPEMQAIVNDAEMPFKEKASKIRAQRKLESDIGKRNTKFRYSEYLESEQWNKKRELVLYRAGYKCEGCGASGVSLDVHHLTYERKGKELLTDLVAYCRTCHDLAHGIVAEHEDIRWFSYLHLSTDEKPKDYDDMTKEERIQYYLDHEITIED